jgi:uncharacterized cofD-like protein
VLAVRGQIVPTTLESVTLCAIAGSEVLVGESKVPTGKAPIQRVFLVPEHPRLNPEAQLAIMNAELVVIGPGSLYTSLLPNLLVDGMIEALRSTPAIKVYVCNVATQAGETSGYSVYDHVEALERYVGNGLFDYVVANSNLSLPLSPTAREAGVHRVAFDRRQVTSNGSRTKYVLGDLASPTFTTHHDPDKLARLLMKRVWSKS